MARLLSRSNLFLPSCHASPSLPHNSSSSRLGLGSLRVESLTTSSHSGLCGHKLVLDGSLPKPLRKGSCQALSPRMTLTISKALRWWQKGLQPNMREIESAQDLVDHLLDAGDKLVIVDFFSPGCGGCKALHPKICQFAEQNPEVLFLQVNYEEQKSMCYSLNVHVLPFFRFYRGAQGRVCSFSCTNATIRKFKDALAKHGTDRCSLGPAKGLEESELLALAANKDLSFNYAPGSMLVPPSQVPEKAPTTGPARAPTPSFQRATTARGPEDKTLVFAGK